MVWLKLLFCSAIIYLAGSRLAKYGDAIAHKTGLNHAWIGIILLALVTSLPELANGISAVTIAGIPDLALGDLFGACMVNMFTLAVLDLLRGLSGQPTLFIKRDQSNLTSILFAMLILLAASLALAFSRLLFDFTIFGVSVYSFLVLAVYLLALKLLGRHMAEEAPEGDAYSHLSDVQVYANFLLASAAVIAAGIWLPFIGSEIIAVMGWGQTFVAVLFLAIATTLPELTVSYSALKLGRANMAVGNLVGSNIFNIAQIIIIDLFYRQGSLFASVSQNMIFPGLFAVLLTVIVYFSQKNQAKTRWPSVVVVLIYLLSLLFLYRSGVLS